MNIHQRLQASIIADLMLRMSAAECQYLPQKLQFIHTSGSTRTVLVCVLHLATAYTVSVSVPLHELDGTQEHYILLLLSVAEGAYMRYLIPATAFARQSSTCKQYRRGTALVWTLNLRTTRSLKDIDDYLLPAIPKP
ncbi:hypothetical protein D3C72_730050 [compost metagenome]